MINEATKPEANADVSSSADEPVIFRTERSGCLCVDSDTVNRLREENYIAYEARETKETREC